MTNDPKDRLGSSGSAAIDPEQVACGWFRGGERF